MWYDPNKRRSLQMLTFVNYVSLLVKQIATQTIHTIIYCYVPNSQVSIQSYPMVIGYVYYVFHLSPDTRQGLYRSPGKWEIH